MSSFVNFEHIQDIILMISSRKNPPGKYPTRIFPWIKPPYKISHLRKSSLNSLNIFTWYNDILFPVCSSSKFVIFNCSREGPKFELLLLEISNIVPSLLQVCLTNYIL